MSIFKELYKLPKRKFTLESNIRKVKHTVANWHLRINKPSSLVHNTNTHRFTHHDIMALHLWLLTGQLVTLKLQTEERGRGAVSQTLLASLTVFLLKCWHQVTSAPFHYHYLHFHQRHCHCFHHVLNPHPCLQFHHLQNLHCHHLGYHCYHHHHHHRSHHPHL